MAFEIKKASREQVKLKLLLSGSSGSGKTMSALKLARGMVTDWSKICVVDTENRSAELYSHLGDFLHIDFQPPYSPTRYIEVLRMLYANKDIECVIVDSISHEWDGSGGCLDLVNQYGGRFADWKNVTPSHNKFIEAIKQFNKHLILCGRTKTEYEVSKDDKNKTKIEKLGTKMTQRDGFEYELTIAFKINERHFAEIDKDRTDMFAGAMPFIIDEATGKKILDWNKTAVKKPAQDVFPKNNDEKIIKEIAEKEKIENKNRGVAMDNLHKKIIEISKDDKNLKKYIVDNIGYKFNKTDYTEREYKELEARITDKLISEYVPF